MLELQTPKLPDTLSSLLHISSHFHSTSSSKAHQLQPFCHNPPLTPTMSLHQVSEPWGGTSKSHSQHFSPFLLLSTGPWPQTIIFNTMDSPYNFTQKGGVLQHSTSFLSTAPTTCPVLFIQLSDSLSNDYVQAALLGILGNMRQSKISKQLALRTL